MLLLDTSIWIDLLRGNDTEPLRFALGQEAAGIDLTLTPMTYLEVLQGARSERDHARIAMLLGEYAVLQPEPGLETYAAAARLYRRCRAAGSTIRTAVDCLIAAIALEHGATLVHNDRDFIALGRIEPALQLYPPAVGFQ